MQLYEPVKAHALYVPMESEESVSSAGKGGEKPSSDKGGCFQMHLVSLSPSGCSASLKAAGMQQYPAQGQPPIF